MRMKSGKRVRMKSGKRKNGKLVLFFSTDFFSFRTILCIIFVVLNYSLFMVFVGVMVYYCLFR